MGAESFGCKAGLDQHMGLAMAEASKLFDEKMINGQMVCLLLMR